MMRKEAGLCMAEVLISLCISSLFLLVLTHQYTVFIHHYQNLEQAFERNMDEQQVVALMRNSIRQAGFTPCMGIERLKAVDTRFMQYNLKAMTTALPNQLTVNRMSPLFSKVLTQTSSTQLHIAHPLPLSAKGVVLIADCYHAEVHSVESIKQIGSRVNLHLSIPLQFELQPPVYVGEWLEETFRVKKEKKALYYSQNHTDLLLAAVDALSATIQSEHGHRLVKVVLHSFIPSNASMGDGKKAIEFITALRIP